MVPPVPHLPFPKQGRICYLACRPGSSDVLHHHPFLLLLWREGTPHELCQHLFELPTGSSNISSYFMNSTFSGFLTLSLQNSRTMLPYWPVVAPPLAKQLEGLSEWNRLHRLRLHLLSEVPPGDQDILRVSANMHHSAVGAGDRGGEKGVRNVGGENSRGGQDFDLGSFSDGEVPFQAEDAVMRVEAEERVATPWVVASSHDGKGESFEPRWCQFWGGS